MPCYANRKDQQVAVNISDWMETAREEIDTIGGWRSAHSEDLLFRYWPRARDEEPSGFGPITGQLVGYLTANHPNLDATPLSQVHAAVSAWYKHRGADRIPKQSLLLDLLERALTTLVALREIVDSRVVDSRIESPFPAGAGRMQRESTSGAGQATDPATATCGNEAVAILNDEWAAYAQLAEVTGKSESAIRSAIKRAKDAGQFMDADDQDIPDSRPGSPKIRFRIRGVWRFVSGDPERSVEQLPS